MRRVILFGGTGWVGHYVALDLKKHNYDVVVASRGRKEEAYAVGIGDIPRVIVDKADEKQMQEFLQNNPFDIVIDMVPTPESIDNIYKYKNSVMGILDTLKTDYDNLNFDATEIQKKIGDPENMALLKDILTKLG